MMLRMNLCDDLIVDSFDLERVMDAERARGNIFHVNARRNGALIEKDCVCAKAFKVRVLLFGYRRHHLLSPNWTLV